MVNQEGTEDALTLLENSTLPGTGIHLCITHGRPVTQAEEVPSLLDSTSNFKNPTAIYNEGINKDDVLKEFEAQIRKVKERGVKITHLDTHHHIHSHPVVLEVLVEMAIKYQLPARNISQEMRDLFRSKNISTPDYFCGDWFGEAVSLEYLRELVSKSKNNAVSIMELMTHPGMVDPILAENSSYRDGREKELKMLCDECIKEFLHALNVQLSGYDSL